MSGKRNGRRALGVDVEAVGGGDAAHGGGAALPVSGTPIVVLADPYEPEAAVGLFDELDDEAAGAIVTTHAIVARPDDGLPPLDADLTVEERSEFIRLLNREMPIAVRAKQLAKLAMYTDTKRAPVGLRAIQEINAITGISGEHATEAAPMFQLPADTTVNVTISKVAK